MQRQTIPQNEPEDFFRRKAVDNAHRTHRAGPSSHNHYKMCPVSAVHTKPKIIWSVIFHHTLQPLASMSSLELHLSSSLL